ERNKPEPGSRVIGYHSWKQAVTNGEFPSSPSISLFLFLLPLLCLSLRLIPPISLSLFSAAAQIFPVLTLLDPDSPPFYVGKTHKQVQESKITKVVFGRSGLLLV
ncbi:unnamed protein product, partial [Brassica rapa]